MLERPIGVTGRRDGLGLYPLLCCRDWGGLAADVDGLAADGLVSLACVADPFGAHTPELLADAFDQVVPFKEHHVTDLAAGPRPGARRHRDYARRALRALAVERVEDPCAHLDAWVAAYDALVARHGLTGLHAPSRASFARQLAVPGLVMFRAVHEGRTVAAQLWYLQGDVGFHHLQASTPEGYDLRAAYALAAVATEELAGEVRWLDHGGGAGVAGAGDDGLARFKRGWATGTRTAWFCGRVLDRPAYATLASGRRSDYFPVYRDGEFR